MSNVKDSAEPLTRGYTSGTAPEAPSSEASQSREVTRRLFRAVGVAAGCCPVRVPEATPGHVAAALDWTAVSHGVELLSATSIACN